MRKAKARPPAIRCKPRGCLRAVVELSRDLDVLESIAWAGILSTSQVVRLHFPSRRTAERRLRALFDQELARSCLQNSQLHRDNVHVLTPLGAERLVEKRSLDPKTVRVRRIPRPQKLRHVLAVRDVFVEFKRAVSQGEVELSDFLFEEDLARLPVFKDLGVIPDALALIGMKGRAAIAIEVDLGTETLGTLRTKFDRYRHRKAMELAIGATKVELLVVVSQPSRHKTVRRLLEEERVGGLAILAEDLPRGLGAIVAGGQETRHAPEDGQAFVPLNGQG